jgi:hypothetical protein
MTKLVSSRSECRELRFFVALGRCSLSVLGTIRWQTASLEPEDGKRKVAR